MVLNYLENFSPILKGKTDNLEDAKSLRNDTFIVVEVL